MIKILLFYSFIVLVSYSLFCLIILFYFIVIFNSIHFHLTRTKNITAATLLVGSGNRLLSRLVSRGTHRWFHYKTLFAILPVWFFMVSWTAGTSVAGGIFVPTL